MIRNARSTARHRREPLVEELGEHALAERADGQRGQRHAELHRGDEVRRVARDLDDGARRAAALVGELLHARPPHGDERVLARDEERVEQDQRGRPRRARPARSSPTRPRQVVPTGNTRGVYARPSRGAGTRRQARRPLLPRKYRRRPRRPRAAGRPPSSDEPLEVGQRLRDREAPRRRLQVVAEERERDLVSAPRLVAERGGGRGEALGVVGDQRPRAAGRVEDRLAVARERDRGRRARSSPRARRGSRRAGRGGSAARARRSARSDRGRGRRRRARRRGGASAGRRRGRARRRPATRRRGRPDRGAPDRAGSG